MGLQTFSASRSKSSFVSKFALRTHEDVSAWSLMKEVLEMDNLMVERNIKEIGAKLVIPYNKTFISFGVSVGEEFCVI